MQKKSGRKRFSAQFIRISALVLLSLVLGGGSLALTYFRKPLLASIYPEIGERGEVLTILGKRFGNVRGESHIEIGGVRPTASSYLRWTDREILLRVPQTADSGLVYVITGFGKSGGVLFTNKEQVPVLFKASGSMGIPIIAEASVTQGPIGSLITILGANFGAQRDSGAVLFDWVADSPFSVPNSEESSGKIGPEEGDSGYELWSDREIRLNVPDGASSGNIVVKNDKGTSNSYYFEVTDFPGTKVYKDRRTYVLSFSVEITRFKALGPNDLYFWVSHPIESANQKDVRPLSRSAKPDVENDRGVSVFHFKDLPSGHDISINETYLVNVYSVETQVRADKVKLDAALPLFAARALSSDPAVPSDSPTITTLADSIVQGEKNPYKIAKLVYEWLVTNLTPGETKGSDDVLSALAARKADPLDYALLFAALCRAKGIPALPLTGYLVDSERAAHPHAWAEFYLFGAGWIPVDPGLGAGWKPGASQGENGQNNGAFVPHTNAKEWYFGNADNKRIAFGRGYLSIESAILLGKTAGKKRAYALQNIFEEVSGAVDSYTSFWGDVSVTGVY